MNNDMNIEENKNWATKILDDLENKKETGPIFRTFCIISIALILLIQGSLLYQNHAYANALIPVSLGTVISILVLFKYRVKNKPLPDDKGIKALSIYIFITSFLISFFLKMPGGEYCTGTVYISNLWNEIFPIGYKNGLYLKDFSIDFYLYYYLFLIIAIFALATFNNIKKTYLLYKEEFSLNIKKFIKKFIFSYVVAIFFIKLSLASICSDNKVFHELIFLIIHICMSMFILGIFHLLSIAIYLFLKNRKNY